MKFENKVVVVTGAASGMGRELVLQLLERGARVAMADIDADGLAKTRQLANVGSDVLFEQRLDISSREDVAAFPDQVISALGAVDGLINDAGIIQPFVRVADLDLERIERVMRVNFYGTLFMTKAFLPHLLARPEAHLANVVSMGGFAPFPGQTCYGASKAAVKLLTEGLCAELTGTSVHVTAIYPGAVATNIAENSGVTIPARMAAMQSQAKPLPAKRAAQVMLDGIERNAGRILVGRDARLLDGLTRLLPERAARIIATKVGHLLD